MKITTWSSLQYLLDITSKSEADFVNPDKTGIGRTHFEFLDLIVNDLNFKIDADAELLETYSENPYIKKLKKDNRLQPAKDDFTRLQEDSAIFFSKKRGSENINISLLLLGNNIKTMAEQYQKESGFFCLSSEKDPGILFEEDTEDFKLGSNKNWTFVKRFLEPHHSLIIADPYLYKNTTQTSIREILKEVIPDNLKGKYHVTFIGNSEIKARNIGNRITIQKRIEEAKELIQRKLPNSSIEAHFYDGEDFHDRYLITNNTCVFSGYGFDLISNNNKVKKETTWVAFKAFKRINVNGRQGVLFYKILLDKLKIMREWIKNSDLPATNNPLLKLAELD